MASHTQGDKKRSKRVGNFTSLQQPAGTIAHDIHATSTKFAPGRLGCDRHHTFAVTARSGGRQGEDRRAPGSSPSLGMTI